MQNKRIVKELIYSDLTRYNEPCTLKSYLKNYLINTGFKYMVLCRMTQYYKQHNKLLFIYYRLKLRRASIKYGFQIPYNTQIGKGIYIAHRGHVIVNSGVKMGDNINLAAGVTIGQANRGKFAGTPTIGSNVWIGTNAVVVGKITIGDDVLIAPNAHVNRDIPSHSIVIGNPMQIIPRKDATLGYVCFCAK